MRFTSEGRSDQAEDFTRAIEDNKDEFPGVLAE